MLLYKLYKLNRVSKVCRPESVGLVPSKKPPPIIDMPIQANEGVLDIENATLRSNAIVTLTNFVTGNDVIRATGAPTLEVYGDPNNGGTEPTIEIVSNVDAGASSTFTRLTSNAGVFTIQSGTNAATDSRGDIAFTSIGGATETEHMRIHGSTGNVYVSSNLEVGTANLFVDTVNSRVGLPNI